jgi:hypothetical protein
VTADSAIRRGLAQRLRTIEGLEAYTFITSRPNVPAAMVSRRHTAYDATMARGSDDFEYLITMAVSWADPEVAQESMSRYLDTAGDLSVKAAVEAEDTLGGVVDFARVVEAREELIREFGDTPYLTVEIVVEVTA